MNPEAAMKIQLKPTSFDFGVTAIEHLFIDEFMPYCGRVELQVYLLGLRFAQEKKEADLATLAKLLDVEYTQITEAYRYWQKQGLVALLHEEEGSFDVHYLSVRDIYLQSNFENKSKATSLDYSLWHQELFHEISSLLALPLSEMECQSLGEFLQDKEINRELILKAFDESKKKKYRNREAQKLLSYWAEHRIQTPEEVEALKERLNFRNFQYREILKALGQPYRSPNIGERQCIDAWLDEYRFSLEIILDEIARITRSKQNPNMNYLHAIFKRLYEEKGQTPSFESEEEDLRRLGRKL